MGKRYSIQKDEDGVMYVLIQAGNDVALLEPDEFLSWAESTGVEVSPADNARLRYGGESSLSALI